MRIKASKNKRNTVNGSLSFVLGAIGVLFFLFLFDYTTTEKSTIQTGIFCNAETVKDHFFVQNGHRFSGGKLQSSEKALSGKYSIMVMGKDSVRFQFELKKPSIGSQYRATVWRYNKYASKTGELVVIDCNGNRKVANTKKKSKNGWQQLELFFSIPRYQNDCKTLLFMENKSEKGVVYFDDFKVEKLNTTNRPPSFSPDVLNLKFSKKSEKKLKEIRKEARQRGMLITTDDSWVKGELTSKNENEDYRIKARYKGDWLDHLLGNKQSFRISIKDDKSWNQLITFSVQHPKTRNYLLEWLYHEWLKKEDIVTSRYDFLTLELNGISRGIFAFEEHFEKQIVEASNRREGPIIKFNEELFWLRMEQKNHHLEDGVWIPGWDENTFQNAEIRPFKASKTLNSPTLSKQFELAQTLLYQLGTGQRKASEIIDIQRFAKYYAIIDLLNASHSLFWINQRFYYNPIVSKLEPIGYDGFGEKTDLEANELPMGHRIETENVGSRFYKFLFRDPNFHRAYLAALAQFSADSYMEQLLAELSEDLAVREAFLKKEFKNYSFNQNAILKRSKRIHKVIQPFNEANLQVRKSGEEDDKQVLKIANQHGMGLDVIGFGVEKMAPKIVLDKPVLISPKAKNSLRKYVDIKAPLAAKYVFFQLPGIDSIYQTTIYDWDAPFAETPAQSIFNKADSLQSNPVFQVREKQILFNKGAHQVKNDIVIPAGYQVIFPAGLALDFIQNTAFLSRSPVQMIGTEEAPILIHSSDKSANGFTVMEAAERSTVQYVAFENLNTLTRAGWTLTGGVTFYESDVDFRHCAFSNNHCEDALNTVRANFTLQNSRLSNTFADGFDADFCTGKIKDVTFTNTGNDSADFSGSVISMEACDIIQPGDKGISVGEDADVTIKSASIKGAIIGVASKDLSNLEVHWLKLTNCATGFAAYQKKPEFGPGHIKVKKHFVNNVKRLYQLDKGSTLDLAGKIIVGE